MAKLPLKPEIPAPSLLKRLARENRRMGLRLAQLELREMLAELESPGLFDLKIDFPPIEVPPTPAFPAVADPRLSRHLPPLHVPLGKIAWVNDPDALPVIGIYCETLDHDTLHAAFRNLMRTHHAQPFARLVFVCQYIRIIPFLGRYSFAYEYVGDEDIDRVASRLAARYGMEEIRNLADGRVLSQTGSSPDTDASTQA